MIIFRSAAERGHTRLGWLDSRHTFSFGRYADPDWMGFGPLRVINEDRVAPGGGFPPHSHQDMEIISIVLEGGLQHRDSLGTGSVIVPGEVQRMSAGSGIEHSEYNASQADGVHFLQIWITPNQRGIAPSYEQKMFSDAARRAGLCLVASPDGAEGSLTIHQDARLYLCQLRTGDTRRLDLAAGRLGWAQMVRGTAQINGKRLGTGDGLAISEELELTVQSEMESELLWFDLPN